MKLRTTIADLTATTLGLIGAVHVLWGRGSTLPFRDRHELNDQVLGQQKQLSPASCNAVAGLLAVAAVSVNRAARRPSTEARVMAAGCSLVLAARAILGFAGRTDLAVPGSTSEAFRRNDRHIYSPLCAALALGSACAAIPDLWSRGRSRRG